MSFFASGRWRATVIYVAPAAAGGPAAYSITGAVTLSLTPSASMLEGRGILGAVPLTLTLAATMLEGRVRAGAVTLALTPAAVMVFSGTTPVPLPAVGGRPRRHARRRRVREPSHQALWGFVVLALTPHARFARIRDPLWTALPAFLDEDLDEDERLALTVADQWLN